MTNAPDHGEAAGRSETSLREQARELVEQADCQPPCDLVTWTQGFVAGWDAAVSAEVQRRVAEIAETMADHDRDQWVKVGQFSREQRIAREVAEMEQHAAKLHNHTNGGAW